MPDKVSFRLVNDRNREVHGRYPFWVGTLVGSLFVFFAFLVAVADITRSKKLHQLTFNRVDRNVEAVQVDHSEPDRGIIFIASPADNGPLSGTESIQVTVNPDKAGIVTVKFLIDGSETAVLPAEPYTYEWDTKSVKNGSHYINVLVIDTEGFAILAQKEVFVQN